MFPFSVFTTTAATESLGNTAINTKVRSYTDIHTKVEYLNTLFDVHALF